MVVKIIVWNKCIRHATVKGLTKFGSVSIYNLLH